MIETLGPYKILERIGKGGIGEVYRARDTRHGRTVAIKVLSSAVADDPALRDRFLRDARATAALSHPNIATLYEVGEEEDHVFLVFDFVPGQTLRSLLVGHPLNPRRAIDLAVQVADALADAHANGILHRDLKPDNIVITPKGNAKVLDFGLAAWTAGGTWRLHAPTMTAGDGPGSSSAAYLSPEQIIGESVDGRTDIFSLGAILFEMLTGKRPFAGQNTSELLVRIVQAPVPPLSTLNPSLPGELDPVFVKALAKSLEQRYESAATFAGDLRAVSAILDVRTGGSDRPLPTSGPRQARRSYALWIVLAVALAALVSAAGWFIGTR
jgi:serine/threonine protein kinase